MEEARIKKGQKDCLICFKARNNLEKEGDDERSSVDDVLDGSPRFRLSTQEDSITFEDEAEDVTKHFSDGVMAWYSDKLLIPWVKAAVIVAFAALWGLCVWSTVQLEVYFDFLRILPSDSYVIDFYDAAQAYTNRTGGPRPFIYFRFVEQSDPEIQKQMQAYVEDLVGIDAIEQPPLHFWLNDYQDYIFEKEEELDGLPFEERLQIFLNQSDYNYYPHLRFDNNKTLVASRTRISMVNVDATKPSEGVGALKDQREVTRAQPINMGDSGWAFFAYDSIYKVWEFLLVTPKEITRSTLLGIGTVSVMSLVFMPHWSGVLFVAPLVMVLYIDLYGFLQLCGLSIDALTYLGLLMSIGLLVDYLMHMVLRYYESTVLTSRDAKVKDVLQTMGAPLLLGGLSSFLGLVPLFLSSSDIFLTLVITFTGVVVLGKLCHFW